MAPRHADVQPASRARTSAVSRRNWDQLLQLLKLKDTSVTHHELLNDWPPDVQAPSATVLYDWLNRATAEKLVRRSGHGTKRSPYQYRLPNKDDEYYDRGELPPLEPMSEFFKRVGRWKRGRMPESACGLMESPALSDMPHVARSQSACYNFTNSMLPEGFKNDADASELRPRWYQP